MKKQLALLLSGLMILSLFGCGEQKDVESEKNTIVTTDFVSYDITKNIIKDTGLSVEMINIDEELSGRDKNKIKNSLLFINMGNDIEDIDEELATINIKDIITQKETNKDDNKIYSDSFNLNISSETQQNNNSSENINQIVINQNNNEDENNNSEDIESSGTENNQQTNNDDNSNSETENTNDSNNNSANNSQSEETESTGIYYKPGLRIEFVDSNFSTPAPSSADKNGYKLGTFPSGYEVDYKDDYQAWLCERISSLSTTNSVKYAALDNGNGTYTIFILSGAAVTRYKVSSIDDIYIPSAIGDAVLYCEASLKGVIASNNEKKILANTKDFSSDYWLDVKNTQVLAEKITNKLCEINPENKDIFETNYKNISSDLSSLDEKYQYLVDSSNNKTIFIGGAFKYKYLTDGYGINYVSIYDYSTQDITPSLTKLSNFVNIINNYNIKYIIKDPESTMDGINSIKPELKHNLNTVIIDTMENVDDIDNTSYIDIMNKNYIVLKKALY